MTLYERLKDVIDKLQDEYPSKNRVITTLTVTAGRDSLTRFT